MKYLKSWDSYINLNSNDKVQFNDFSYPSNYSITSLKEKYWDVIDLKNFTVDDLKGEWATKFLSHMKSEDFFNISKHPTAKMEVISIKNNKAKAKLTIKGLTREVTFPIREVSGKIVGKLIFDRTKFGMIYGSGNFFKNLGDKVIKDEVEISFTLYPKT